MNLESVNNATIIKATVGSTLFGLNLDNSDVDEMGVCVEGPKAILGFSEFEQHVSTKPDVVIYGLRKFLRLALKGNPTILTLLFAPREQCSVYKYYGEELQGLAPKLISKRAASAFLGYLTQQRQRLLGERGQKDVNRQELVDKYGFDTKYAMHMLRLGFQGIELLNTGKMTLPMVSKERDFLLSVRTGKVSLQECLTICGTLERDLAELREYAPINDEPDTEAVEHWMLSVYQNTWNG